MNHFERILKECPLKDHLSSDIFTTCNAFICAQGYDMI